MLKDLYPVVNTLATGEKLSNSMISTKEFLQTAIATSFREVFKPDELGRLVRRQAGRKRCDVTCSFDDPPFSMGCSLYTSSNTGVAVDQGVDILAKAPDHVLWMIEVKDYRLHRREKDLEIWNELALKARNTLADLVAGKMADDHSELSVATQALQAHSIRVVLHLEQPKKPSKLFPRPYDPEKLRLKLKQLLKPIDAHPMVADFHNPGRVSWTVTAVPPSTA